MPAAKFAAFLVATAPVCVSLVAVKRAAAKPTVGDPCIPVEWCGGPL